MLGEKLHKHHAQVWLLNTGWTGGPYGTGHRMELQHTRAMIEAALNGKLEKVETRADSVFGLHVPTHIPSVPDAVLDPRGTWPDSEGYDRQAAELASMFRENFDQYSGEVSEAVREAGPRA
jgi:phosphoenolpyruvate carboxykinase (ATP)